MIHVWKSASSIDNLLSPIRTLVDQVDPEMFKGICLQLNAFQGELYHPTVSHLSDPGQYL
jgi:hypothetical protein